MGEGAAVSVVERKRFEGRKEEGLKLKA